MAWKELPRDKKEDITLDWIRNFAVDGSYERSRETANIVIERLREERSRNSGLRMNGNFAYIPLGGNGIVIGDLHGDYESLFRILKKTNFVERVKRGSSSV